MPRVVVAIPTIAERGDAWKDVAESFVNFTPHEVTVVPSWAKGGWAAGLNEVYRQHPDADYFVCASDDMFATEGWWEPLEKAFAKGKMGVPQVRDPRLTYDCKPGQVLEMSNFPVLKRAWLKRVFEGDRDGPLPDDFHYYADDEISDRVPVECVACPDSVIEHRLDERARGAGMGEDKRMRRDLQTYRALQLRRKIGTRVPQTAEQSVCVGYVHGDLIHGAFVDSLMTVMLTRGIGSRVSIHSGTRIATSRNSVVKGFLQETDCEWLWMVDTDMTFEPDIIERLVERAKHGTPRDGEIPILGALCFSLSKKGEAFPIAFRLDDSGKPFRVDNYPRGDLIEVAATGAACLLIRRDVLEKMEIEYDPPYQWFEETSIDGAEIGEDVAFCFKARELGFPVYVDTSIPIGHLKMRPIGEEVWLQQRAASKRDRRKNRRK